MRKTGRRWAGVVAVAGWLALAGMAQAADLVITSYSDNGVVGWTYPTSGVAGYRIEWAANLATDKWTDIESGLRCLAPTGATMAAEVPLFYRIKAMGAPPTNMVYIPPGTFRMGDTFSEADSGERPVHNVFVSGFYMDRYEVTKTLWDTVAKWAATNGYDITTNSAAGKGGPHPAQTVTWYEAVKWCNARSQSEGLAPCYFIDTIYLNLYMTGNLNISNTWVNWNANGYRLPTEAEWEKAARGGASGYRFPWADNNISHGMANYQAIGGSSYDLSNGAGYHPAYTNEGQPYTSLGGVSFAANGYGLYDMAGNVWEWCWDWYRSDYYTASPAMNPQGPAARSGYRVKRGGSWFTIAYTARCSYRNHPEPDYKYNESGFRCARGL